jgi:hypothetical protein
VGKKELGYEYRALAIKTCLKWQMRDLLAHLTLYRG